MNNYLNKNYDLLNNDPFFGLLSSFKGYEINSLRSDIKETEEDYIIDVELAGFKKEDISLSFENKNLIVKASYKSLKDEKTKYLHIERTEGIYSRKFYLGDIKHDNIKANFENGLLTIIIPKDSYKEIEKTKSIAIN